MNFCMKNKIFGILYLLFLLPLLPLLSGCSSEESDSQVQMQRMRRMVLDGAVVGYGSGTRAASLSFPKGAALYLQLNGYVTTAIYDGSTWMLAVPDGLDDNATGTCTAYYFEGGEDEATKINFDFTSAIYSGTGSFSNSIDEFTLSVTVRPLMARLHFRGTAGTHISVTGLTCYDYFTKPTCSLTPASQTLEDVVQSNGYTKYVYVLLDSDRTLTLTDGTNTFTRTFDNNTICGGESGFLDIPTISSHNGWSMEATTNIDVNSGDYPTDDTDWNPTGEEKKEDGNFTGDEYGDDIDWNPVASETENAHEYVDLGLSVKWASCNIGAENPENYGDYYAWGETETKNYYGLSTYKWMAVKGSTDWRQINKYQIPDEQTEGIWYKNGVFVGDNKTVLDVEDDVAHVKWGGKWRMPTADEQDELRNNCNWTWTTVNGIKGYKVVSKSNGNSIFLPSAGYMDGEKLTEVGVYGLYWSGVLYTTYTNYTDYAYHLYFKSDLVWRYYYNYRHYGLPVRPVCP